MKFGITGLGSMGGNLALRTLDKGHEVAGASRAGRRPSTRSGASATASPLPIKGRPLTTRLLDGTSRNNLFSFTNIHRCLPTPGHASARLRHEQAGLPRR